MRQRSDHPRAQHLYSTGEVAWICGVHPQTISRAANRGEIEVYATSGTQKDRLFELFEVMRFAATRIKCSTQPALAD